MVPIDDFKKEIEHVHGDVLAILFMDIEYPEGTESMLAEIHDLLDKIEDSLDGE